MAEPIEMPFGLRTVVGPENHVLDGVQTPPVSCTVLGEKFWLSMSYNFGRMIVRSSV